MQHCRCTISGWRTLNSEKPQHRRGLACRSVATAKLMLSSHGPCWLICPPSLVQEEYEMQTAWAEDPDSELLAFLFHGTDSQLCLSRLDKPVLLCPARAHLHCD